MSHHEVYQRMRVQPSPSLGQPLGHPGDLFEEIEMTMTNARYVGEVCLIDVGLLVIARHTHIIHSNNDT